MKSDIITSEWMRKVTEGYRFEDDATHYDPHIEAARKGDVDSLLALTRWKNSGKGGPMNLSGKKRKTFDDFCSRLDLYLGENGQQTLRSDFAHHAPVWSTFWAHVLYGTPIFDWRTHACYLYFTQDKAPTQDEARIYAPHHWQKYDLYTEWFEQIFERVHQQDETLEKRDLDRALFMYGEKAIL